MGVGETYLQSYFCISSVNISSTVCTPFLVFTKGHDLTVSFFVRDRNLLLPEHFPTTMIYVKDEILDGSGLLMISHKERKFIKSLVAACK